jgi:L-asparaginase
MDIRLVPFLLLLLLSQLATHADDPAGQTLPNVVILARGGTNAGSGATSTATVGYEVATLPVQALIDACPN